MTHSILSLKGIPTNHTAIVGGDGTVYGVGQTAEQAWADAREWADRDSDGQPILAGLSAVPCTEGFAARIQRDGVIAAQFTCRHGGALCLRSEAAL